MSRRLPEWVTEPAPAAALLACLAVVATAAVAGNVATRPEHKPAVTADVDCWDDASCAATKVGYVVLDPRADAYRTCLRAANTPGPAGFATEVCEPLCATFTYLPLSGHAVRYCPSEVNQ